ARTSADSWVNEDRPSRHESFNAATQLLNPTGDIATTGVRQRDLQSRHPAPDEDIEMVQGAGANTHQDLACTRLRPSARVDHELIRPPVLPDERRLHGLRHRPILPTALRPGRKCRPRSGDTSGMTRAG